jgi:ATP/ADP translocase
MRGNRAWPRAALAPALALFAILVAHALLETARDALFLARLGADRLALAYLAIAACAMIAIAIVRRGLRVREPRRVLVTFLVVATAGTAALAGLIATSSAYVFALYVWTGFVATLVVPSFWTAIDRSLALAEAKRTFGVIGAGGVVGAMAGSALASVLARVVPASRLVTAGAVAFGAATVAAAWLVPREAAPEPPARRARVAMRSRQARRYVRLLLWFGIVSTVALTLGDLTFKRVMSERLAADELATWFGAIYAVLNAVALAIQVLVTPRLLARWGIGAALAILPVILVASALGFAMTGALIAVIALKLGDGGLRHSLHRIASEILYLPVPAAIRDGGKLIADALGQRGGQAIAAMVAGALVLAGGSPRAGAAITAAVAAAWFALVLVTRRAYITQLRESLQAGEIQRDVALPPLDGASAGLLERSIASEDELEALAALDLLARRAHVPASALRDPRESVVRHALSLLAGDLSPEATAVLKELAGNPIAHVRAAALAAAEKSSPDRQRLLAALDDPAVHVRAVALVHLANDDQYADLADEGIGRLLVGSTSDRVALAEALAFAPSPRLRYALHELLDSGDSSLARSVLGALARAPDLADLERLLPLLASADLRADARKVFLGASPRSLDILVGALDDPATPVVVRRHLPRTLMLFASARAASALAMRLPHEADGRTELKILRALGRMRGDDPHLAVPAAPIREYLRRAFREAARYRVLADEIANLGMPASATTTLVYDLLIDKYAMALERVFRALGIVSPSAGWRSAHDAIAGGDTSRLPAARELVDAMAPNEVRGPLLALIDDVSPAERRARLAELAPPLHRSHESFVTGLLGDPSESLRCAIARHIAEHQLIALRGTLARLRPVEAPPLVERAFDEALERLHA